MRLEHFSVIAATIACAPLAHARTADRVRVDVAEQPLGDALVDFAIQANVTISTPRSGFGAARARELRGVLSVDEGLRRLLAHSNFGLEKLDAVTFRIVERAPGSRRPEGPTRQASADEIVVTAARRPHTLDRFAASASVIDSDVLAKTGAGSTTDLAQSVAGLGFTNLGPGRNKIILRGLSDGAFSGHTESTIGIYLEDSRITYGAPDPDLKLVDIDRIEILRGPQGVLYGGGAIGGIYRITMGAPDLADSLGFASIVTETTRDGGVGQSISVMSNVPLIKDRLGLRVVGYRETTAGWLDNAVLGAKDTNRTVREGVRATMLARLGGSWTVSVRALAQGIDSQDSQYINGQLGERVRSTQVLEPHDNDFALLSTTVRGGFSLGEFSSTTSILHHAYNSRFDSTGAFADRGVDPASVSAFDDQNDLKFLVEEARLTGVASPFPWTLGAFVSFGTLQSDSRLTRDLQGASPSVFYAGARTDDVREYALFGEASWPITRQIEVSFGLRAFRTELTTDALAVSAASVLSDRFTGDRSHMGVSPQVRLSYEPNAGAFYYLQAGNGYRSGGFNTGVGSVLNSSASGGGQPFREYGADELWSYEAGIKHAFLEGRFKIRAAAFWQIWENIQTDQLIAEGLPFTGNVGNGEVRGGELEASYRISDALSLNAHLTYADAEVVKANASFTVGADAGLPGTPRFTSGGSLDYQRPVSGLGTLRVHVGAVYVGSSSITFSDQTSLSVGDYIDGSARVGLETEKWRATLYVDNVLDADAGTFSYGNVFQFGSADLVTPLRPRTVGVELARRF